MKRTISIASVLTIVMGVSVMIYAQDKPPQKGEGDRKPTPTECQNAFDRDVEICRISYGDSTDLCDDVYRPGSKKHKKCMDRALDSFSQCMIDAATGYAECMGEARTQ